MLNEIFYAAVEFMIANYKCVVAENRNKVRSCRSLVGVVPGCSLALIASVKQ